MRELLQPKLAVAPYFSIPWVWLSAANVYLVCVNGSMHAVTGEALEDQTLDKILSGLDCPQRDTPPTEAELAEWKVKLDEHAAWMRRRLPQ